MADVGAVADFAAAVAAVAAASAAAITSRTTVVNSSDKSKFARSVLHVLQPNN